MTRPGDSSAGRDGCGSVLLVCLATCLMLAFNGLLAALLYTWLRDQDLVWLQRPKLAQGLLFLGPVMLIFAEWWLIDLCTGYGFLGRRAARRRRHRDR